MMRRRIRGILLTALSFITLILPLAIVCLWKRNEWFAAQVETTKVSIGFIIALIFALCLLNGAFKSLSNNFTTIFTLGIFAVVTYLMDSIIQDLTIILIAAMIGYGLYLIINSFGKRDLDYVKEFTNERARMDARNEARSLDGSV